MNKKIPIWILIFVLLVGMLMLILYGSFLSYHYKNGKKLPVLRENIAFIAETPVNVLRSLVKNQDNMELTVSEENRFGNKKGFNVYREKNLNLLMILSRTDYENKRQIVEVVNLNNFEIIKKYDPYLIIKELTEKSKKNQNKKDYVLRENSIIQSPYLDSDLNLTFISNSNILIQVNKDGKLNWFNDKIEFHHTFNFLTEDDDYFWAIATDYSNKANIDKIFLHPGFKDENILKINKYNGEIIEQISITELYIKHNIHNELFVGRIHFQADDPIHLNDVQPVIKTNEYFKKGNLFISASNSNMVLLIDPEKKEILWKTKEKLFRQHDVDILENGKIAIFNNNRVKTNKDQVFKNNEIMIYNFNTNEMTSPYNEFLKENEVRTINQGLQEFTDQGIMIEEQNYGRILFFDDEGLIFEYINRGSDNNLYQVKWSSLVKDKKMVEKILYKINN